MDKEQILKLRSENKNSEEIATILNLPKIDVDLFLVEHYHNSRSKLTLEQMKQMIIERHKGRSFSKICKDYTIADSGLSRKLKS